MDADVPEFQDHVFSTDSAKCRRYGMCLLDQFESADLANVNPVSAKSC
jgi:hypothetical protein